MGMKFLADNGGLQALIQAIKDQLALFDHNKQNKLVAGRGITINQSTRVISSDGEPNVQADWNMATESSASFIRNKPDIYTKREIDSMFSATITFERVDELPATGTHGTVYLVPKQGAGTGDIYDEYLWLSASGSVEAHYELIGSTSVDLTNYYTKAQTDNLLGDKVDKESGKGLSTEDFTTAEKTKLGGIEAGAEVNVQSDWNQSDSTKDDYIKNKPTLRQPASDGTAGQYLKSNGNGNAPSWETMDTAPTDNSAKAVTSGGVKTALDGKQASVTINTNANTPTDNDTVIMQDNGNTGTTSFLRRKLSTLWEYFKKKPYGEAYLVWGGKNHNANLSPIDANLISEARANRLARYPIQNMKIEDSRDDGVTWTENTRVTDLSRHILTTDCAGNANNVYIGGSDSEHLADEHCKTRITFTTYGVSSSILYARIEKICLWIATNGTTGNTCTVLGRLQADVEADNDVWATLGGPATLGGWSDWNVIQTDFTTYGNQKATQYGQFRLLFECTGRGSSSTNIGLSIQKIRAYGMRCWAGNNPLALYNSFFAIDSRDNATFPANVTASKHITSGGTTNQMVAGNGDLKDIAETCKTATSLNGGKYGFRIIKIGGEDYTYLIVLADVTGVYDGTINNKLYGIQGLIFMQRDGAPTYNNLVGRITATASYSSSFVRLYTDVVQNDVVKPCVIKKDGRWLLCLSAGGNNGTYNAHSIIFFGRAYELADEPFTKIRVDSTFTHYHDGGAEIEYIKQASRYPLWASFGGNNTQIVKGTGELETYNTAISAMINSLSVGNSTPVDADYYVSQYVNGGASNTTYYRRPMSALWNYIKSKISTVLGIQEGTIDGKVNLQPDFTASQIDYSAGNVGKWQKVLRFPEGTDLVINMKKTAMGSDSTSTLWFSSSSMGDSYTSLFGNHSVRFVHDGGYVFLVLACKKSTNEPTESYTFQIAHSSVPMSDIVAVTDASPITATPKEPSIVYQTPLTTGAVSFNVNSSGAGSVNMSGHNDFLGNMTAEASDGVTVTMTGATEGQIYRFVFTRNIEGGVTFKQSNVAFCTISGDVNAGDTITLTAVSNTADGWIYEQQSAGIKSSDGSINVGYEGSTADLSLNLPPDLVRNNVYYTRNSHLAMAIGLRATCDTSASAVAVGTDSESGNASVAVGGEAKASNTYCVAVGIRAVATSSYSTAVGKESKASGSGSCAYGSDSNASGTRSMAFGKGATAGNYSMALGYNAKAQINATAYGYEANGEDYSTAIGYQSNAKANSTAVGYQAKAGIPSSDTDRPMLKVYNFEANQFSEGGSSKFALFCETTDDVTITVGGSDYTLTPPAANKLLFVINNSLAQYMTSSVTGYAKLNGEDVYLNTNYYLTLPKVQLSSNYYAVWMDTNANYLPAVITSLSILAYYTTAQSAPFANAIGYNSRSVDTTSSAIGTNLFAVRGNQTVIGCGNIPDYDAWFIVGAGSNSTNGKKNILKIDSNERMVINAGYVGGTQTIDMNQQNGTLSNITKAVYKIKWDGTGTIRLTLGTGGCVEGQRVSIVAVTNDVAIFGTPSLIPVGTFGDFLFIDGAWIPSAGVWNV